MRKGFSTPEPGQTLNLAVFKQVVPYLLEFKGRIMAAFACLVLAKIASVYLPFILKYTVDSLNTDTHSLIWLGPVGLVFAYGLVRLMNVLFGELRDMLFGRVTERAMRRIGLKVFNHLHALDLAFHLERKTGGLSRDIERGVSGISFVMRFFVFNIGPTLLELALVVAILTANFGLHYALVIIAGIVAYVWFTVVVTNWRLTFIREANVADNATNSRAVDSLLNFESVKYFNNEMIEGERYDIDLAQWESARRKNRLSLFALNGGQAFIIAASMTAMLWFAATDVMAKNITLGDFVLVNAFMMQIFMPLNFLGFVYREIKGSMTNIENMFALLAVKATVVNDDNALRLNKLKGDIEFKSVEFGYHDERRVLNELNCKIEAGSKVAFVGPSGAGKSTITKLLFRFYDAQSGAILLDGHPIKTLDLATVRKNIGVVPQDTVLFNASIFDNVHYGRLDATEQEVYAAIEAAQLKGFIDSLPDKHNTQVGERGLKLSGGEKQRVAIARTLLKGSPVLIFDEATSSLDSHNERSIMATINHVAKGHTSIMIAHRLSTVVDADTIFYLENGVVKEQGTHQALLSQNGCYAKLWQSQSQHNKKGA